MYVCVRIGTSTLSEEGDVEGVILQVLVYSWRIASLLAFGYLRVQYVLWCQGIVVDISSYIKLYDVSD
jgi:hypothetical protein